MRPPKGKEGMAFGHGRVMTGEAAKGALAMVANDTDVMRSGRSVVQ